MKIRQVENKDIEKITNIYNWYILNTIITFELVAIAPQEMAQRVQEKLKRHNWLVGEVDQDIVGYAYYGAFRPRPAYNHTIEATIYLAQDQTGKGFGKALYSELIHSAKAQNFREIMGVIALPNAGSVKLHQSCGFEEAGVLKRAGYKFEKYIDVGIWQLSLHQPQSKTS